MCEYDYDYQTYFIGCGRRWQAVVNKISRISFPVVLTIFSAATWFSDMTKYVSRGATDKKNIKCYYLDNDMTYYWYWDSKTTLKYMVYRLSRRWCNPFVVNCHWLPSQSTSGYCTAFALKSKLEAQACLYVSLFNF